MAAEEPKVTPDEPNVAPNMNTGEEEFPELKAPKGLKYLTIGLGLAIVFMIGLILYKLAETTGDALSGGDEEAPQAAASQPASLAPAAAQVSYAGVTYDVERPAGAELVSVTTNGAEIIFHFRSDAADIVTILDRRTGAITKVNVAK